MVAHILRLHIAHFVFIFRSCLHWVSINRVSVICEDP